MWRNLQELPKLQSPLYLLYFLQMGGPAGETQHFFFLGGGVGGFGDRLLDCSMGLTGQLSEI